MEHVVCFVGEGGKETGQFLTLPVSFRMTGVGTEDKHSAGQQKIQRLGYRFPGRFPEGRDCMVPAGKPAEIKNHSPDGFPDKLIHPLVTAAEEFSAVQATTPRLVMVLQTADD